ncbi:MAG: hypothetical protein J0I09_07805 [Sphingobacteriia bacterium]|nr:hypothetical protein [Sphingobacteriia bacterium]
MSGLSILNEFCLAASTDTRITHLHICVYMALFQYWHLNGFQNPVQVSRRQIMLAAKVKRTTYHKCIKDLHNYGYIEYLPSYHPLLGSAVYMQVK